MSVSALPPGFLSLPKAELHLHLEGSIEPATVCALAARHGVSVREEEARASYAYRNFGEFIAAFKWVTSFLRTPEDYALITCELADQLRAQNAVYAELTLSVGVMLLRHQDVEENFAAICAAASACREKGLYLRWVFDAVRQFGAGAAMEVARLAARFKKQGVVAYGIGGDELALPAAEFRAVYDYIAEQGLHRLVHAGEIGGPREVRDAIELLGAERIGHGIAAIHDPALMDLLAERRIPLEMCPTSNLRTGALARQLGRTEAQLSEHPLPQLFRRGVPVVLSSDDPAMFQTSLLEEYANVRAMGITEGELFRLARSSHTHAFLTEEEREALGTHHPSARSGGML